MLLLLICDVIASTQIRGVKNKYANTILNNIQTHQYTCANDTSIVLNLNQINDNYCDCVDDGIDEPGTSACSHTLQEFYCANIGAQSKYIHTSYVNDNICDCCDGSDEYDSQVTCPNNCYEHGQQYIQSLNDQLNTLTTRIINILC